MSLNLVALGDVVQDTEDEVAIAATSHQELGLTRGVPASGPNIVGLNFLNWRDWCLFHIKLREVVHGELVLLEQLIFASDPDVTSLRIREDHQTSLVNFTIDRENKILRKAFLDVSRYLSRGELLHREIDCGKSGIGKDGSDLQLAIVGSESARVDVALEGDEAEDLELILGSLGKDEDLVRFWRAHNDKAAIC